MVAAFISTLNKSIKANKKRLLSLLLITSIGFIALQPQQFLDLWLTRDQQGQILFLQGKYQKASTTYSDTRWQAFSAYGNENYNTAATLYSQHNSAAHC